MVSMAVSLLSIPQRKAGMLLCPAQLLGRLQARLPVKPTSPGCDFAGMFAMQDQLLTSLRHWEGHPQDVSEKPVKSSTSAGVHMAMYIHMHTALTVLNAVPSTRNLIQSLPEAKKLKTL